MFPRIKKIFAVIALCFFGIIVGIFLAEIVIAVFDLHPENTPQQSDHYTNCEVYDDPFVKKGDKYYPTRDISDWLGYKAGQSEFAVVKPENLKRIFLLGESVAEEFNNEILLKNLNDYLPGEKFEVINAGRSGYDSFRIKIIAKKIVEYSPDYVVIFMGNNDNGWLSPLTCIDYLFYKCGFLKKFATLRLFQAFIYAWYNNDKNINLYFEKNIKDIIALFANKNINVVFVTLPLNQYDFYQMNGLFFDDFEGYARIEKNFSAVTDENNAAGKRFIRSLSAYGVTVADFAARLKKAYGAPLNFDLFTDEIHYWPEVYDIAAKVIIESAFGVKTADIDKQYMDNLIDGTFTERFRRLHRGQVDFYKKIIPQIEYLHLKKPDKLKAVINDMLLKNRLPEPEYHTIAAYSQMLINNKNYREAFFTLDKLIEIMPDYYHAYVLKGYAYYLLGDKQKADELFSIATGINEKNIITVSYLDDNLPN
jgi:lysophospholipase L1-like esterase